MIAAAGIALVGIGGCGSSDATEAEASGLHVVRSSDGERGVGDAAQLQGTVAAFDDCLVILKSDEDPAQAEPDEETVTVPVFDTEDSRPDKLEIGDDVDFGGGSPPGEPEDVDMPKECSGQEIYFTVVWE